GSPQIVELAAVVRAFHLFQEPVNLITDSAYVANIIKRIEGSFLKEVDNKNLCSYLLCLKKLLEQREHKYFISHIKAQSSLPGFLVEGNAQADKLTMVISNTLPNIFEQAKLSHAFFHPNAQTLMRTFRISKDQAKAIISACPDCQLVQPPVSTGAVNPRGLQSLKLWQTECHRLASIVPEVMSLPRGAYSFLWDLASLHVGKTVKHACPHFLQAFTSLGIPQEIKTDNGPAYRGRTRDTFLKNWGVRHIFGIPNSSTGQAIIERMHHTLKSLLDEQKRG
ncbi:hypothetical protein N302_13856, partial [Corvus brachyrhynchos]